MFGGPGNDAVVARAVPAHSLAVSLRLNASYYPLLYSGTAYRSYSEICMIYAQ